MALEPFFCAENRPAPIRGRPSLPHHNMAARRGERGQCKRLSCLISSDYKLDVPKIPEMLIMLCPSYYAVIFGRSRSQQWTMDNEQYLSRPSTYVGGAGGWQL